MKKLYKEHLINFIIVFVLPIGFIVWPGCVFSKPKPVYFNDSEIIISDSAGQGVCQNLAYDCVVMSKGRFRTITGTDPELGKKFIIEYK